MTNTNEFNIWQGMLGRCLNKRNKAYKYYGGRGITICDRWMSFESFFNDMGERPSKKHSIDRKDNNSGYSVCNCYWATRIAQAANKRNNFKITAYGKTMNLNQWVEETGINRKTIKTRIKRLGWSEEKAVSTPVRKKITQ